MMGPARGAISAQGPIADLRGAGMMGPARDIIAAIATAPGEAAISIVRLSGEGSAALVEGFFDGRRPLSLVPPRQMELGAIRGVDTVLAVRFERGASYTGEESVEVHCHGGRAAAAACMELFTSAGARIARPGEFTLRAFLSGRIDLAQAEAVAGVISAAGAEELGASRRALQGEFSAELRRVLDAVTDARAELEASLDYPEEIDAADAGEAAELALREISALLDRCRTGAALRSGVTVAIAGPPNAGKSSLMNAMLGARRSIVTDAPGTTRDAVDAVFLHRGLRMTLVDTAGIRPLHETAGPAEDAGIEIAREAFAKCDLGLVVADASQWESSLPTVLELASSAERAGGKCLFLVRNKCDLVGAQPAPPLPERAGPFARDLRASALTGDGIRELKDAIAEHISGTVPLAESFAVTQRVIDALSQAHECAVLARTACDDGAAASLLASACDHLASPLGADAGEEVLDAIFSRFCVGK